MLSRFEIQRHPNLDTQMGLDGRKERTIKRESIFRFCSISYSPFVYMRRTKTGARPPDVRAILHFGGMVPHQAQAKLVDEAVLCTMRSDHSACKCCAKRRSSWWTIGSKS